MIPAKNIPEKLKSLLKNEKGSHFFLDEAFGIGIKELKEADAVLSKDVYFWIAYQHVDDAPIEEKLAGKPRPCLFDLEKMTSFMDDTNIVKWNRDLSQLIKDMEKSLVA